jgi:hypothetical protein
MPGYASLVFRYACKTGLEGIRLEAPGVAVQVRPLARLAQVQESGCSGGEA